MLKEISSPKMNGLQNSSYFKTESEMNFKPKIYLSARPKSNSRIYDKINSGIIVSIAPLIKISPKTARTILY